MIYHDLYKKIEILNNCKPHCFAYYNTPPEIRKIKMHGYPNIYNESPNNCGPNSNYWPNYEPNREIQVNPDPENSIDIRELSGNEFICRDTILENGSPVRVLIICEEPHKNEAQSLCEEMRKNNLAFVKLVQREQLIETPIGSLILTYTIPAYEDPACAYELKVVAEKVQHKNVVMNCFQFEQFEIRVKIEKLVTKHVRPNSNSSIMFEFGRVHAETTDTMDDSSSSSSNELCYSGSNGRIHRRFNVRFEKNN
jgi:hypothetical protein